MIEILILYILHKQKSTLYGVRKTIKDNFLYLNSATFGTIHPAMARLIEKGFVSEKKDISKGGRRKNTYSVTSEGKKHLVAVLKSDFSSAANNLDKQLSTKIVCCDILPEVEQKNLYMKIIRYYQHKVALFSKLLGQEKISVLQKGQLGNFVEFYQNEILLLEKLL